MSHEREHVALRPEQATIPPGHAWNRLPVDRRRRLRRAGRGGLRDSRGGESEAVLLLVARVVPVLPEPGPRRALLRADPVRGPGRLGDRAATDRRDDLRDASRDGGPLPAGAASACTISTRGAVPGAAEHDALLRWKAPYLNVPFFLIRAALYFGGWSFIALALLPRLARSGRDGGSRGVGPPAPARRARHHRPRADPDLRLDRLDHVARRRTGTRPCSASISSRAPSSGSSRCSRSSRSAMRGAGLLDTVISAEHLHDIGKLLFAFTAFWAYIAFSQFFLMWYANIPEETIWYKARLEGSWMTVSLVLMVGTLRGSVLLPDGADRQAERSDPGRRAARGSSPCTSSISTGRSCRRSIPSGLRPSAARRGRVRGRRRVLRGGGELADATAGARPAARPEARRIARLRERLTVAPGVACATGRVADGGVRCRVGAFERPLADDVDGDDGDEVAMTKEPSMRGQGTGCGWRQGWSRWRSGRASPSPRRPSPEPSPSTGKLPTLKAARHGRRPGLRQEAHDARCRTRCWSSATATPWGTSWSGSRRGSRPGRPVPLPKDAGGDRSERLPVQAARDGDHGRPALQDPQLRRHPPQRPRAPQGQQGRSTRAMPATVKEATTTFDKAEAVFQIKCDVHPWMSAYVGVFTHPFFSVTARTGSSRSRASTRGPTRSPPGTRGWGRRRPRSPSRASETKTQDFKFAAPAAK